MKITVDPQHFEALELRVLEEVVESVIDVLEKAGVRDAALAEAAASISFSVAAIIDGSRVMELDGEPVLPFLTFARGPDESELVASRGGSGMHEYVHGIVEDMLGQNGLQATIVDRGRGEVPPKSLGSGCF
ncbi:MAG TPA: hypothetical protein VF522_15405 [Ramlibacter sp.]|uniref:hypothetical protein n=1 Tax=Ramlibacter sp. TaxID=1917967 RepID=UPI002ED028B5